MEDMHVLLRHQTAVEASFIAPGLGPYRPDEAPYVDQNLHQAGGVIQMGLEWHPKILLRALASGTVVNPYVTIWCVSTRPQSLYLSLQPMSHLIPITGIVICHTGGTPRQWRR